MKLNRGKIIKYIVIFLAAMLFFTLISSKINYMLMPEVYAVSPGGAELTREITASGTYDGGRIIFRINMEKDPYIEIGDTPTAEFSNISGRLPITVKEKNFDADTQSIECVCKFERAPEQTIYDGQNCYIRFSFNLGFYDTVLPKECVIREGNGYYVYRLETVSSVVGSGVIVRRLEVSVIAEDDLNAAVSAALSSNDRIVRYYTKPLRNELKVRLSE